MPVVEFNESLHAVYFLIHFGCYVAGLFLFPLPQGHPLLSRPIRLAEGCDHAAILTDIQSHDSVGVGAEDGLARGTTTDVPNHQHGIFSCVCSHDDIAGLVVGSG